MKAPGIAAAALFIIVGCTCHLAGAQSIGITRTELMHHDLSIPGRESIQVRVDFAPGGKAGMHMHPGEEIAYVLKGTLEYRIDGRPPITVNAGETVFIPARTMHAARNVGSAKSSELATYIVEKGEPIISVK